jgi:hypothetical protein
MEKENQFDVIDEAFFPIANRSASRQGREQRMTESYREGGGGRGNEGFSRFFLATWDLIIDVTESTDVPRAERHSLLAFSAPPSILLT